MFWPTHVGDAGRHDCLGQVAPGGDANTAFVHKGPFAFLCPEEFVGDRVVCQAGDNLACTFQRNINGKHRDAMEKICCAVEWIDDPAVAFVTSLDCAAFFHQEAVAGAGTGQLFAQGFFRTKVCGRYKIARAFE